jgi:ABC-type antimicrobial peptide transport system permease subunit
MFIYFKLLAESFRFATNALQSNKLRTLLSLLGVTIGIFSIIAVLAAVDSLDRKITKDLSSLDKNTIYLMNPPFILLTIILSSSFALKLGLSPLSKSIGITNLLFPQSANSPIVIPNFSS